MTRPPDDAREADVRHRGERQPVAAHRLERGERGEEARAVVRADRGHICVAKARGRLRGGDPGERLRVLVEGQHRDDRQARDALDRLDRRHQLVEVEERLDHEEVDAAPLEDPRLLGEDRRCERCRSVQLAQRADRAGDEDVAAGDLARLARELHARRVDALELVLEVVRRELAAGWRRRCSSRSGRRPRG